MAKKKSSKFDAKKTAEVLAVVGNSLILFSLIFLYLTFAPVFKEEVVYRKNQLLEIKFRAETDKPGMKESLVVPNRDFSLVIPKIYAVAPVFKNIDAGNQNIFLPVLKKGVAHALGTSLPGGGGNVYIFAHSTDAFYNVGRYNAVFYLIGKLKKGDEVLIYYQGDKYRYVVTEKKVVEPSAGRYLGRLEESETLTLQTCYPPGTTLKRLVVVARLFGKDE